MGLPPESLTHDAFVRRCHTCVCVRVCLVLHHHHGLLGWSFFEYGVQPGRSNTPRVFRVFSLHLCLATWKVFHTKTFLFLTPKDPWSDDGPEYFAGLMLYESGDDRQPWQGGEKWQHSAKLPAVLTSPRSVVLGKHLDWEHFFLYSDRTWTHSKSTSYLPFTPQTRARVSAWALGQTLPSTISNDVISTVRVFLSFQILSSTQWGGLFSLLQIISSLGCWFSLEFLWTPLTYPVWPPSFTSIL